MRLRDSFVHNVVVHPLLFVRDLATVGGFAGVAVLLSRLHDATEAARKHEFSSVQQRPWTDEAEAMVYRSEQRRADPASEVILPPPKTGSVNERVQRARRRTH